MTAQDARERAWQEFDRNEGWPQKDSYSFRVGFDKGKDAAKREDEQHIAALVGVINALSDAIGKHGCWNPSNDAPVSGCGYCRTALAKHVEAFALAGEEG